MCAGDPAAALRLSSQLISLGADVSLRSRWTNMNALHYAAYFDVPELIRVLLKAAKPRGSHPAGQAARLLFHGRPLGLFLDVLSVLLFLFLLSAQLHLQ